MRVRLRPERKRGHLNLLERKKDIVHCIETEREGWVGMEEVGKGEKSG